MSKGESTGPWISDCEFGCRPAQGRVPSARALSPHPGSLLCVPGRAFLWLRHPDHSHRYRSGTARHGTVGDALDEICKLATTGTRDTLIVKTIRITGVRRLLEVLGHPVRCGATIKSRDEAVERFVGFVFPRRTRNSFSRGKVINRTWVMDRTGPITSRMLNKCRRAARQHVEANLGDFVPLQLAIPELRLPEDEAAAGEP